MMKLKFGQKKEFQIARQNPNPVKHDGKYSMQHMKSMIETGFQRGKVDHKRRVKMERKALISLQEIEEKDEYLQD